MVDVRKHATSEAGGSAGAVAGDAEEHGGAGAHAHEQHKEPPYLVIWFVLLVLTLAEVGYAFLSLPKFWLAFGLIVMALWKAALVALYYMHLRFEPRRLWVLAASPLPLVAILLLAVLTEY